MEDTLNDVSKLYDFYEILLLTYDEALRQVKKVIAKRSREATTLTTEYYKLGNMFDITEREGLDNKKLINKMINIREKSKKFLKDNEDVYKKKIEILYKDFKDFIMSKYKDDKIEDLINRILDDKRLTAGNIRKVLSLQKKIANKIGVKLSDMKKEVKYSMNGLNAPLRQLSNMLDKYKYVKKDKKKSDKDIIKVDSKKDIKKFTKRDEDVLIRNYEKYKQLIDAETIKDKSDRNRFKRTINKKLDKLKDLEKLTEEEVKLIKKDLKDNKESSTLDSIIE